MTHIPKNVQVLTPSFALALALAPQTPNPEDSRAVINDVVICWLQPQSESSGGMQPTLGFVSGLKHTWDSVQSLLTSYDDQDTQGAAFIDKVHTRDLLHEGFVEHSFGDSKMRAKKVALSHPEYGRDVRRRFAATLRSISSSAYSVPGLARVA